MTLVSEMLFLRSTEVTIGLRIDTDSLNNGYSQNYYIYQFLSLVFVTYFVVEILDIIVPYASWYTNEDWN